MKTRYKNHEIKICKDNTAIANGQSFNDLADAIMEIDWTFCSDERLVTMDMEVAKL